MKLLTNPLRLGAIAGAAFLLSFSVGSMVAQPAVQPDAVQASAPEPDAQADLLKAYLHLQEKLNEVQLVMERNRVEYEKSALLQAEVVKEQLSGIQAALDAEHTRQQEELRKSNMALLWVGTAFVGAGILAMLFTVVFQWRAVSRMTERTAWHPQLTAGSPGPLLPAVSDGAAGSVVDLSSQRLMSVIERLERRVFDLEHATATPAATVDVDAESASAPAGQQGPAARITLLLGKGQALLNEDHPELALECYNEILQLDANHPEALVKKGSALERLKQDEEALRCYDRAIQADKTLTIAYLYKGGIYNRLERYNEALECYEQALRAQGHAA